MTTMKKHVVRKDGQVQVGYEYPATQMTTLTYTGGPISSSNKPMERATTVLERAQEISSVVKECQYAVARIKGSLFGEAETSSDAKTEEVDCLSSVLGRIFENIHDLRSELHVMDNRIDAKTPPVSKKGLN